MLFQLYIIQTPIYYQLSEHEQDPNTLSDMKGVKENIISKRDSLRVTIRNQKSNIASILMQFKNFMLRMTINLIQPYVQSVTDLVPEVNVPAELKHIT